MPNRNGKGPLGLGPLTGRGKGRCRRKSVSEKTNNSENESGKTTFGVGRGGRPYGGGKGKCWGGGKNIDKKKS